jgi:addiction module RelB/DinJ family antitoxin
MGKSNNAEKISLNISPKLRNEAETILNELGLTTDIAVNVFFKQIIKNNGIPFKIIKPKKIPITNEFIETKLNEAKEDFKNNNETYDAFAVLNELEKKYAL